MWTIMVLYWLDTAAFPRMPFPVGPWACGGHERNTNKLRKAQEKHSHLVALRRSRGADAGASTHTLSLLCRPPLLAWGSRWVRSSSGSRAGCVQLSGEGPPPVPQVTRIMEAAGGESQTPFQLVPRLPRFTSIFLPKRAQLRAGTPPYTDCRTSAHQRAL